jgi:hypothetical protein
MNVILLTIAIVAISMFALSIGLIFSNRCIRGSCGGPNAIGPDGQPISACACKQDKQESESPQATV